MGAYDVIEEFCDAQAITADDTPSEKTIDMNRAAPQIGVGNAPYLVIRTNTAPTDAGDTLAIEVQQCDDDSNGDPDGSWANVFSPLVGANGAEVVATDSRLATAGEGIYEAPLPYQCNKRHLRLMFRNTTSNGTFTIDAYLSRRPRSALRQQVWASNVGNP